MPRRAKDRLVAVAGLGLSQQETVDAARKLSKADLPMVGDPMAALATSDVDADRIRATCEDVLWGGAPPEDHVRLAGTLLEYIRLLLPVVAERALRMNHKWRSTAEYVVMRTHGMLAKAPATPAAGVPRLMELANPVPGTAHPRRASRRCSAGRRHLKHVS
jgi:hypothetical protein